MLLVDDEPMIRLTLARVLGPSSEVQTAESGAEAKAILTGDAEFDVVLCDLMMPDVGGVDLYEWVEREAPALAAKFVFMTGGAFTDRARQFIDRIDNPRFDKPLDLEAVTACIARMAGARAR